MQLINFANTLLVLVNIPMLLIFAVWFIILLHPRKKEKYKYEPSVSVLIPAYNEEKRIRSCISAILTSDYPKELLDIVVIDDGSKDKTAEVAKELGVRVIKTKHRGKAYALNEGLRLSKGEIVIVVDSDIRVSKETIRELVGVFEDKSVGVATGMVRVDGSGVLGRFQKIEFAYVSTLINSHYYAGVPIPFVYGAMSAFRRDALKAVGGFSNKTASEDSDTYLEIVSNGWGAAAVNTIARTEQVHGIARLVKQRERWMYGGLQVFFKHIKRAKCNLIGCYVLPLFGFWPFGAGVSLSANAYVFAYWFRPSNIVDAVVYTLRWINFVGVPMGLADLPKWGFPIAATTGILVGLMSLLVLAIGVFRSGEKFDIIDALLLSFYPVYGWLLLGIAGVIALIHYAIKPNSGFVKSKGKKILS